MKINQGKVAVGLSLKVIEEMLQELQAKGLFGNLNSEQSFYLVPGNETLHITANVGVKLKPLQLELRQSPQFINFLRLRMEGNVELLVSSTQVSGLKLYDLPFWFELGVELKLIQRPNRAPSLVFNLLGLGGYSGIFTKEVWESMVCTPEIKQQLGSIELDIIDPVIQSIEETIFPDQATRPNRASYAVGLHLLKGEATTVDAYALLVDLPGGNVNTPGRSFVPKRSEIIIHFSKSLLDGMVLSARLELKTYLENVKGANIQLNNLNLTIDNNQFYIEGEVKEKSNNITGTVSGPVYLTHIPGSTHMALDMRKVKISLDLPWWMELILSLLPSMHQKVHTTYPNMAQQYVQNAANEILTKIGLMLNLNNLSAQGVNIHVYPDKIALEDGAITAYVQVLIKPLESSLVSADYIKLRRRFDRFYLLFGRTFMYNDLAKFMKMGLVQLRGYHSVDGRYIRSNPDNTDANNLLKRFGRK